MALALRFGVILELGARMARSAIVYVLDLPRPEAQLDMQFWLVKHGLYGGERGRRLVVHALAA